MIDKVNTEATRIMRSPEMQERLLALGTEAAPSTPREFSTHLAGETSKWARVLKEADIRATE